MGWYVHQYRDVEQGDIKRPVIVIESPELVGPWRFLPSLFDERDVVGCLCMSTPFVDLLATKRAEGRLLPTPPPRRFLSRSTGLTP